VASDGRGAQVCALLDGWLSARLDTRQLEYLRSAAEELERAPAVSSARAGILLSQCARHVKARPLAPTAAERAAAARQLPGWDPERWTLLEAARVRLVLAHAFGVGPAAEGTLEEAFSFADEGELCALLRSAALLPRPEVFRWRVGEGCRSNMRSVFEAAALDTPYPAERFDAESFRQVALKCLFVGAPLWRLVGLDRRADAELARMALDYAEERSSAGRAIPADLWLCLAGAAGSTEGERARTALESTLAATRSAMGSADQRAALGLALLRMGERERLEALHGAEDPGPVRDLWARALEAGRAPRELWRDLPAGAVA
jgi:hypothetical protein